jgi:hypothetical protein
MGIPMEVRYNIYAHAAARPEGPDRILSRWYEKKDVKEQIAELKADDPNVVVQVKYHEVGPNYHEPEGTYDDDALVDDDDDEDEDEDEDLEQDQALGQEDDDEQDEGEEEEGDGDNAEDMEEDDEDGDGEVAMEEADMEEADADGEVDMVGANVEEADADSDDGMDEDEEDEDDWGDAPMGGNTNNFHTMTGTIPGDPTVTTTATTSSGISTTGAMEASQPRPIVVRPHTKWRHTTKFLRISGSPPPVELLQVSKTVHDEAKDWFYNVAVIRIDVTGSFAYTSMFETALDELTDAAFSPFESIRKVEVTFVWDTEWLRGPDCQGNECFFQSMLFIRADKVVQVLQRAPELKQLTIHWHDSIKDDQSASLRYEILEKFDNITANLEVNEHYLQFGRKPHRKSILGKKRLEFQTIADAHFNLE